VSDASAVAASRRSGAGRRWLVAALVTLVFAALVARETSAAEITARLRALPLATFLWALVALAVAGVPRALRLQRLLPGKLTLADAYAFNQVYNVVTATIPSGLGEAASAWLMRRALAVPLHLGLVALFVTRFLDLLVLLGLFLLVVLGGLVRLGDGGSTVVAAAAALLAGLTSIAALHALARDRVAARLDLLAERLTRDAALGRARRRVLGLAAESLRLMPDGRRGLELLALTTIMQLLALLALLVFLDGSGVPLGLARTLACFVIYVLLRLLPLQGIAGIGTTAAWWAIALSMLGVPAHDAATVGAVLYVAFYVVMLALSALCLPLLLARRGSP
jgi:hypothetical protein